MTLEWRRQWRPDLNACPWRPLNLANGEGKYFIKSKFDDVSYEILVTDLTTFWYENLGADSLKTRVRELNPCFEATLMKILDQIKDNISKEDKETMLSLVRKDSKLIIEINSHLVGMPFSYTFEAASVSQEVGRDHLTIPLMVMVGELLRQRQELFKMLKAKDNQISDYKSQGAKVSRKYLETSPFDEVAFSNNMFTSKDFEEEIKTPCDKIFTQTQELYCEIVTRQAWLNSSPVKNDNLNAEESISNTTSGPSLESWTNRVPGSIIPKNVSPNKSSPDKSPASGSSTENSPAENSELLRRQALEKKLEREAVKEERERKKKKLKF